MNTRYLINLTFAIVLTGVFAWLSEIRGKEIDLYLLSLCVVFGLAFVPLVVIRLPLFRAYYVKSRSQLNRTHHHFANQRAAPVMVGLVTGVTLGGILTLLNVPNPVLHSFLGAVNATIISFYYDPKF